MRFAYALFVLAAGCSVLDFNVDQDIEEQVIEGSPLPGVLDGFLAAPIQLDLQSEIAAQETGPVDQVRLTSLSFDITATARPAGDTDDWSFLTSVDLYVESTMAGSNLPRTKVASVTNPGAVTRLVFTPVDGVNLLPYVNEGARLVTEASGNAPPDDVSFAGRAVFRVSPL